MKHIRTVVALTQSDALTHADALLHMTTIRAHVCTRARIPLYRDLRQSVSVRQTASVAVEEKVALSAFVTDLANRVRRLCPLHRDPKAFHEAKSEIEADLRQLARVLPADDVCGRRERMNSLHEPGLSAKVPGFRKG